ncbi:hypothetical protein W97_01824 [Coniosporium apollinis CBS 100218]|uniref:Pyrroline-5-carboxylate reductase n=1 Tax=Coniosporium apollinis (strain CBS 100218) TaxID=1168221 RepID=R7YL40_CONA1|nr:uncharacterized protein W97_01824 [Coniosporium apollinis CBS 100218]EON62600.1 hypothetical protein W97_01824 [Coniosporium apollinis CBS 100218]
MSSHTESEHPTAHPPAAKPLKKLQIAILGCGFMGTALLSGILQATEKSSHDLKFSLSVRSEASLDRLQQDSRVAGRTQYVGTSNVEAARLSDVVLLGFRPHQLSEVLSEPGLAEALKDKLIISLLAGVPTRQISASLADSDRVARVIPSIGAQINESMSIIAAASLNAVDKELVIWLFQQVGRTQIVSEELIGSFTAVSAACHALTVVAADAIVDGSVAEGISRPEALELAAQCLRSSASMLQGHMSIEGLKESMSIANGITINAILELDRGRVRPGISDAVRHAVRYARGMSGGNDS